MNILHNCDLHIKKYFVNSLCKQICQVFMYNNSLEHTRVITALAVLL